MINLNIPRITLTIIAFFLTLPLSAFEYSAYIPHYRIRFEAGAENSLGRPMWDTAPSAWDQRIAADGHRQYGLMSHWSDAVWSQRLSTAFDTLYYHIDLKTLISKGIDPRHLDYITRLTVPTVLSILGTSADFLPLMNDALTRSAFIDQLLTISSRHALAGIDIDWEFPGRPREQALEQMAEFIAVLVDEMPQDLLLSVAVSRWRLPEESVLNAVDSVRLMAYDGFGRHATFEAALSDSEALLARYSLPPDHLVLGIPWYGRNSDPESDQYATQALSYRNIVKQYRPHPKQNEAESYYYNGPDMVRRKVEWAKERGLAGVFIWEPFLDINSPNALMAVIRDLRKDNKQYD